MKPRPILPRSGKDIAAERAIMLAKSKEKFSDAIEFIINKLQMPNASMGIFNINNANIIYDPNGFLASVAYTVKTGFVFTINAARFPECATEDIAMALLHETMHFLLDHLVAMQNPSYDNHMAFNVATDLIINDILMAIFVLLGVDSEIRDNMTTHPLFGPEILGFDCSRMKLANVYDEVIKLADANKDNYKMEEWSKDSSDQWQKFPISEKDINKYEHDKEDIKQMFDKESKAGDETKDQHKPGAPGNSDKFGNEITTYLDVKKQNELLAKLFPFKALRTTDDTIGNYTWNRQPKNRISLSARQGVLPLYRQVSKFKPHIIHAIDVSGSVSNEQLMLFCDLWNIMPRFLWEIDTYVFNSEVQKIVLDSVGGWAKIPTGGGTRFDAVAELASSLPRYPDGILMITDGGSYITLDKIPEEHRNKWVWIIDCANDAELEQYKNSFKFGKFYRAKEIARYLKK